MNYQLNDNIALYENNYLLPNDIAIDSYEKSPDLNIREQEILQSFQEEQKSVVEVPKENNVALQESFLPRDTPNQKPVAISIDT